MKVKKILVKMLCAATGASILVMLPSCGSSSDKSKDTSEPVPSSTGEAINYFDGQEMYYCDTEDGELILSLLNSQFCLSTPSGTIYGDAIVEGDYISLKNASDSSSKAKVDDEVLTLTFKGDTYNLYKKASYAVTYMVDGTEYDKKLVWNGRCADKPADPTKEGSTFVAWYKDANFKEPYDFTKDSVKADLTLYGRFQSTLGVTEYSVSFFDGEEKVFDDTKTVDGVVYNLPTPEKEGATFAGWYYSDDNDPEKLTAKYDGQKLTSTTYLYAVYESTAPIVSVEDGKISWTAVSGVTEYTVTVTLPDGSEQTSRVNGTSKKYEFIESGEYKVVVSAGDLSCTRYYNYNTLNKVSVFNVVDSQILMFNSVPNATKYLITVEGEEGNYLYENYDNGLSTNFNFANCKMVPGGLKFTVTAVGTGYASSTSMTFTYNRLLSDVETLTYAEDTATLTWSQVENATNYVVEVTCGLSNDTYDVKDATSFCLKDYTGAISVKVYPQTAGFNSPEGKTLEVNKATLASPMNVIVEQNEVSWDAVEGATGYTVTVGNGDPFTVTDPKFTFDETYLVEGVSSYTVTIVATCGADAQTSLPCDGVVITYPEMNDNLKYENGMVSWDYVLGAKKYVVKVNGLDAKVVDPDTNSCAVTLSKKGVNEISIAFYKDDEGDNVSEYKTIEVYAETVYFNSCGGVAVTEQYYAVGDTVVLPETTYTGYNFAGWYNLPGGAKNNACKYESGFTMGNSSLVLYAYWTPKSYSAAMNLGTYGVMDSKDQIKQVLYNETFTLPVPQSNDELEYFAGWYTEENGEGVQITDETGVSVDVWSTDGTLVLYPKWVEPIIFTIEQDGKSYSVKKGSAISKVSKITIPSTYNGLPVTIIDDFTSCTTLVELNIPDTIKEANSETAFYGCTKLEAVNVYHVPGNRTAVYSSEDGVLFLDNEFTNFHELCFCPRAKTGTYHIPEGVQSISQKAFYYTNIDVIFMPTTLENIDSQAFYWSSVLRKVIFDGNKSGQTATPLAIAAQAFYYCKQITSVTLPGRITEIDAQMFYGCSGLTRIDVDNTNLTTINYKAIDGLLCDAACNKIIYCPAGRSGEFTIPTVDDAGNKVSIHEIGANAFYNCTLLTKITITDAIKTIEEQAFYGCSGVTELVFEDGEFGLDLTIDTKAFYGCSKLTEITLPKRLVSCASYAFGNIYNLKTVNVNSQGELKDGVYTVNLSPSITSSTYGYSYVSTLNIGADAGVFEFAGCFNGTNNALKTITVAEGNKNYATEDGVVFNKTKTKLLYYPDGKTGSYTIPDTVVELGSGVFNSKVNLTSIVIPEKITNIGDQAFYGCTGLTTVTFTEPSDPTTAVGLTIGKQAFSKCNALTTITIPARTTSIGDELFYYNTGLTSVTLNGSFTDIPASCFYECGSLTTVTLGDSITKIGNRAFYYCDELTSITFGSSVESIDEYAFYYCTALTELTTPTSLKTIAERAFYNCKEIVTLTLNEGLESIGDYAFYGTAIATVNIPSTCTSIGEIEAGEITSFMTFSGCNNLTSITVSDGNTAFKEQSGVLYNESTAGNLQLLYCPTGLTGTITIPANCTKIIKKAFYGNSKITGIIRETDASGVATDLEVGDQAFYNATSLSTINLPGLKKIGQNMFYGCEGLVNFEVPYTVTEIVYACFWTCDNLKKITFQKTPDGVTELPLIIGTNGHGSCSSLGSGYAYGAFEELYSLEEIEIPERTAELGSWAFFNCTGLKKIILPASLTLLNDYLFCGCTALETIVIPENSKLKNIGEKALWGTAITEFDVPEGVTSIGNEAFKQCNSLETFNFASTVVTLGEKIFNLDKNLKTVTFKNGSSLKKIVNGTFTGCTGLTNFTVPASITTIEESAFSGCTSLTNVVFADGSKLETIGANAFEYTALTEFHFPTVTNTKNDVLTVGSSIFKGVETLTTIYLSKSVTNIDGVFDGCTGISNIIVDADNPNYSTGTVPGMLMNKDSTAIVLIYGKVVGDITLVDTITTIDSEMFKDQTELTSITLPAGVTTIKAGAFDGCSALTTVNFATGSTLVTVEAGAFKNCTSLTTVVLPNTVTTLDEEAFSGCSNLTSVTLPTGLTELKDYLFYDCTSLTTVDIPSTVTTIGKYCFGKSGITTLTLPATVTTIGEYAFNECSGLTALSLPTGLTTLGNYVFKDCTALASIEVPASITALTKGLFSGCTSLATVTLPDTMTDLGEDAFENCTSLDNVVVPSTVTNLGKSTFVGCTSLASITLPEGLTSLGSRVFEGCTSLATVALPSTLTSLGNQTFKDSGLTTITLPASITSIGSTTEVGVFEGCANLSSITCNGAIVYIATSAFNGCTSLTAIDTPQTLATIEDYAFANSGLTSITIPSSVTSCGINIFLGCTSLATVTFAIGNKIVADSLFNGCTGLTTVNLPEGITTIGASAFEGCTSLSTITFPATLTTLKGSCFRNCGFTSVELPATVTTLNDGTNDYDNIFEGCVNLTSFKFASTTTITRIPEKMFYNCTSLATVELPEGVQSIGGYAFSNCSSLTSINLYKVVELDKYAFNASGLTSLSIPSTLKTMGTYNNSGDLTAENFYVFGHCKDLTTVTFEVDPTTQKSECTYLPENMFEECSALTTVTLPEGLTRISNDVFYKCSALTTVTLPESLTVLGKRIFYYCTALTSLELPDALTTIGQYCFSGSGITDMVLPANVINLTYKYSLTSTTTYYSTYIFEDCTALTSVEIQGNITLLPSYTFSGCTSLTNIILPNSITEFGSYVFKDCTALENMVLPASLTELPDSIFKGCTKLNQITWPTALTAIGSSAFEGCTGLTSITIPSTVNQIKSYAFSESGITSIVLPSNISALEYKYSATSTYAYDSIGVFSDCKNLTSVEIQGAWKKIPNYTFQGCESLTTVTMPSSLTTIGEKAFYECSSLQSVNLPQSVKTISNYAFSYSGLESIKLPQAITYLGSYKPSYTSSTCYVFQGCTNLKSVIFEGNITGIGSYAFDGCTSLQSITLPDTVTLICDYAFRDCAFTSFTLPKSLNELGEGVFAGCSNLSLFTIAQGNNYFKTDGSNNGFIYDNTNKLVLLPGTCSGKFVVTNGMNLSKGLFAGTSITEIEIESGMTEIEQSLFSGAETIKKITLPNTITEIGNYAFEDCTGLETINIPSSVKSIGNYAFDSCTNLTTVTFADNSQCEWIGTYCFYKCESLSSINLPSTLKQISSYMFEYCTGLTTINLDTIKHIGTYAFAYSGLTEVTVPEGCDFMYSSTLTGSATSTSSGVFKNCESLVKATINAKITTLPDYIFNTCTSLTTVKLPDTLETIGSYAFRYCISYTELDLPDSVKYTKNYAFAACGFRTLVVPDNLNYGYLSSSGSFVQQYDVFGDEEFLEYVDLGNKVTRISHYTFENDVALKTVIIPETVTEMGNYAFTGCTGLEKLVFRTPLTEVGSYVFRYVPDTATIYFCFSESVATTANGWSSTWKTSCSANIVWNHVYDPVADHPAMPTFEETTTTPETTE